MRRAPYIYNQALPEPGDNFSVTCLSPPRADQSGFKPQPEAATACGTFTLWTVVRQVEAPPALGGDPMMRKSRCGRWMASVGAIGFPDVAGGLFAFAK
jgi:hypothetical protein